jgi:hypothetical protein
MERVSVKFLRATWVRIASSVQSWTVEHWEAKARSDLAACVCER